MATECKHYRSEIAELSRSRAAFYRLLSSLYWKELTSEQILQLKNSDFGSDDFGNASMDDGWSDIAAYLAGFNSGTRQDLAVDYAHTFLAAGNNDDKMAVPFESVFVSETGLLMQEPRDEVCQAYYREHIAPPDDLRTPEDHISFELEFLAVMAERHADALDAGDAEEALRTLTVQQEFHAEHVANWIDIFCDAIEEKCRTRFYQGVAKLTRGWAELDGRCMGEIRDELRASCEYAPAC